MASNWQETYEKLKKRNEALNALAGNDIVSTLPKKSSASTTSSKKKKDEEDTWFKAGAFDDGYDLGDITKTILGTVGDVAVGAVKGLGNLGEGVLDLGTYAASGVADLFGNEEAAERIKKRGQETLVNDWLAPLENKVDKNSLLGNKADNITQGLGYIGGIILTGGLGSTAGLGTAGTTALTTGLTGVSGMGSGMSEAYQGGATDKEALTYGTIAGLAEAGTELIFGGLGKAVGATGLSVGLSSADDMLAKKISSKFSNQLAKNFTEYGVKASAEGLEEVMSGFIQGVGKYYTYQTEQDGFNLKQIIEDEQLLDQFIAGAVTSGIAQSGIVPSMKNGSLIEANKSGRDFITGYTQNEQAVIDAEIAARTEGKQLTNKQKSKIEAEVIEDFEKGYVSTDRIESTLGGDTYNELKSVRDNKANLETQIKELENKPNAEITVGEMEHLHSLREQLEKINTNTLENKLQAEIGDRIKSDSYLQRSYQEKAKRSQEFTYKATEKDSEFRKGVMESTKGKLNDTTRSHETAEALVKLSEDRKMQYKFTNNAELTKLGLVPEGKTANGLYVVDKDGSREILVNTDSKKYIEAVLVHETSHDFKNTSPETYTKLQDITREFAEAQQDYSRIYSEVAGMYKNVEGVNIEEEVTSRLLEDYLGNKEFIGSLSTKEPNIVKKIINEIKYLYKKFTAGSPEARKLVELQHDLEKTYREAYKQTKATDTKEGTKYSLLENKQKFIANGDVGGKKYKHGYHYDIKNGGRADNVMVTVTKDGYVANNALLSDEIKGKGEGTKIMLDLNQQSLKETGKPLQSLPEYNKVGLKNHTEEGKGLWESLVRKGYAVKNADNSYSMLETAPTEEEYIKSTNVKYSLDNLGRELSKGQIEFFKDSKVRDEEGRLLEVYHATNSEFTIFDKNRIGSGSGSNFGKGFYFATYEDLAADYGDKLGKYYLNIKNPFNYYSTDKKYIVDMLEKSGYDYDKKFVNSYDFDELYDVDFIDDFLYEALKHKNPYNELSQMVQNAGFDGIIAGSEVVAFEPNQIKRTDNLNPTSNPDIRYSLTDNQGRELSKGQQEYFKDSKARDDDGSLTTVYHTSPNAGFTVFEGSKGQGNYKFGKYGEGITYFTDSKDMSESYSRNSKDAGTYEGYVNLTNPYVVDAEGRNWNRVTREYSQETYEKYKSLNEIERDYLMDLATWDDGSLFAGTIRDAHQWVNIEHKTDMGEDVEALASAYKKLEDVDLYNLYEVAANDFSDESMQRYSNILLSTNGVVKKALEDGSYDGVIIKNVVDYGSGTSQVPANVYVTFSSEQFKNADNLNPTTDKDIRYSLSEDNQTILERNAIAEQLKQKGATVDGDGNVTLYHITTPDNYNKIMSDKQFIPNRSPIGGGLTLGEIGDRSFFTYDNEWVETWRQSDDSVVMEVKVPAEYIRQGAQNEKEIYIEGALKQRDNGIWTTDQKPTSTFYDRMAVKRYLRNHPDTKYSLSEDTDSNLTDEQKHFLNQINEISYYKNKDGNGYKVTATTNNGDALDISFNASEDYLRETYGDAIAEEIINTAPLGLSFPTTSIRKGESELLNIEAPEIDVKKVVRDAKKSFGLTTNFVEAGYMTPDGKLLDFSGKREGGPSGMRTQDHREINVTGYNMQEFIDMGNIRMKPESNGFELTLEPTKEQYNTLRNYIDNANGEVYVDINKIGSNGNLYDSAEYKAGTPTSKIINDIKTYYETGSFPKKSEFADFYYSLSKDTDIAPTSTPNQTAPQDIRLEVEEAIAPLKEEIAQLTERLDTAVNTADIDYAPAAQEVVEQQSSEAFNTLEDSDMPIEVEEIAPVSDKLTPTDSLFDTRDYEEVGSKKINAYQYDNPEVRPYFQTAAREMLTDLQYSTRGERYVIGDASQMGDNDYYYSGTKRATTDDIAELLDGMGGKYKYTYAEIEKGLRAIIEDNGAENNAVSKRIEFYLDKRLREGYTDIDGYEIPADTDYLDMLRAKGITDYYNSLPLGEAPVETVDNPVDNVSNSNIAEKIAPLKAEAIRPAPDKDTHGYRLVRVKTDAELQTEANEEIAKILTEEPKTENTRNKRKWAILKANVLDKGIVFEDVALKHKNRELMGKWDYTLTAEARGQNAIGNGHYEYDPYSKTSRQVSKSLNDIREEVDNTGLTAEFYDYIYHKHNVDRMRLEGRYEGMENKPVFGYNVTAEQSQQVVNKYESQHPEFITFAQDVYDYLDADRQVLVDNGVISQETADLWKAMYPHYVPIRRAGYANNAINVPLDTGRTGVNAPIKKATGGNKDILPLFDTMASRTLQTYRATAKNSFGVELKNTIGTTINSQATNIDEVIDSVDAQEELLQEGKNGQKPTFTVFENGEKVTFEITPDMYDALKPLDNSSLLSKTFLPINKVSNFHRGLLTEYNPVFMLTNAIKDAQDILINSQHAVKTYAKVPEAFAQLIKKGYWYQEYMNNGGEQNSYFDSVENTFKTENKGLAKILDLPPLSTISQLNNFIERTPRLAEYIASREAGKSIEVAMLDAARVTTNFKAGGNLTKWANRNGATFLNASVQGAMQQVRNIREANSNGIRGWANLATKFAIAGLPALLLNGLLWEDDEEYEELSDYVKQNYYIVAKNDDGTFVRIPKGRTLAVIQEGIQQMKNLATGEDEADLKTFIDLFLTNLAPNNPIENNILSPIIQAANNKTWYGEDLVPTRLQDMPAAEQYDESTDSFSRWLGEKTNFSPVKINYLLDQYSGGLGDVVLPMLTPEAKTDADTLGEQMLAPLKSKFTTNSTMNNQNVADFYDTSEKLTTEAKKSNATDEDVLRNKYINSVKAEMNELYAEKREIQNSNLSNSEKYKQVLEVQKQINELSKEALNDYKNVDIYSNYATAGDRQYRLTDEGEWQKINDKQLEKQNNVTSGLGITPNDYWSNKEEYDYAYENPSKYALANAISDYSTFKQLSSELYDIKADKDADGKSISGSRKDKVFDYINNLNLDFEQRVMLAKMEYPSYDEYNQEIIDYLNNRNDISYEQMVSILTELGFTVKKDGTIVWD